MRKPLATAGRHCVALALLAALCGCATTRPIPSDGPVSLRENEGIVILHVDTDTAISSISISGLRVLQNLPRGRHVALQVLTAGSYSFSTLRTGNDYRYPLFRMAEERLYFKVEPGKINYPGLLFIRRTSLWPGRSLHVRSFSRAGQALSELLDRYPQILDRYPIVNGRVNRDDFLELLQAKP